MANLEQRMAEEGSKIKAESYQKVASLGGWSGGGRTLWAVSIVGALCGAAIGLVAPFFPLLVVGASGFQAALTALPISLAVFTATGMSMGFGGGLVLGRISGTSAAVAQEQEKRMKEWTARQLLAQNPNAEIVPDVLPAPEPEKPFWQRIKDNYRTYINPRVGLTFAAVAAVGGLVMAAAFIATGGAGAFAVASELGAISGLGKAAFAGETIAANTPAIIAYFTGVMASFGALFSFNLPKITSAMTHFFGELSSGRLLGREWGPKQAGKIHSQTEMSYNQDIAITDGVMTERAPRQYASFQELVSKSQEPNQVIR